ncbi:DUF4489 domain-containing protein [Clostridium oryzae]|uniref:DUF4489 domain-containing protein n=1 Tax=Clostridium oryzae TaxID=1450648 RepID=A0A1V4IJN3_9CLOT|nr:DUF4489 domain-containing protein [Clostridium oryzae]OPJ60222.1 hypothetical protein CLORY_29430 [Clostridium oryzae]
MDSPYNYNNFKNHLECDKHNDFEAHNLCPLPGKALLEANVSNFELSNIEFEANGTTLTLDKFIAAVNIDTTCLSKAKLLIHFGGILDLTSPDNFLVSNLIFTLFRVCDRNKVPQPLTTFSHIFVNTSGYQNSSSLNFEYTSCDNLSCCGANCTYILKLTSITAQIAGTENISINGVLSALAVEKQC